MTAHDQERRVVFLSALEQAEQLFRAAESVGYASRPLLAFYGLSQAGRALAAAATAADQDSWQLRGHGLTVPNLDEGVSLPSVVVQQVGKAQSSFIRLSELLKSPPLPDAKSPASATIADLWDTLPEAQVRPLRTDLDRRPAMYFSHANMGDTHALVSGMVCGLPRYLADSQDPVAALGDFMSAYPHAAGYTYVRANTPSPQTGFQTEAPAFQVQERVDLQMHWRASEGHQASPQQRHERLTAVMSDYGGHWYLVPAVGGNDGPQHPLLSWWAVLFALSMLARYQPAQWTREIDVNSSTYAVALEHLLDDSLIAVPRLIYSTLGELVSR
jgi:hypothetical protein